MSKHLVTGSSGYVGAAIVNHLHKIGEEINTVDIIEDKKISEISNFYKKDISDINNLDEIFNNVKFVHHNAALVPLTKAGKDFYKSNVIGTKNILELSLKNKISHFSHMSSSAIFGKPNKNQNVNYNKYNPTGLYGNSKYLAELEVLKYKDLFESYSIIRPRPIIGKGRLGIFEILFDWVKDNKRIPIIGNGKNIFQFAHIDDLVEVSVETATKNISGIFNIGTNRYSNLENDLNESFKLIGSKSRILPINDNLCIILLFILDKLNLSPLSSWHYLSYSWNFHYDLEETFKKLSWRPKYSNIEIICEAYKSYYDNINNLGNNESTHRSKVNQKFLRLLKVFL